MQAMFRIMRNAFIGVNIALYLFFIAIVLAFSLSPTASVTLCGARVLPLTTGTDVRQAVSIAYSVIIAFLSLVIGVLFLIFGLRTYRALGNSVAASNNNTSKRQVRLYCALFLTCSRSCSEMPLLDPLDLFSIVSSSWSSFWARSPTSTSPSLDCSSLRSFLPVSWWSWWSVCEPRPEEREAKEMKTLRLLPQQSPSHPLPPAPRTETPEENLRSSLRLLPPLAAQILTSWICLKMSYLVDPLSILNSKFSRHPIGFQVFNFAIPWGQTKLMQGWVEFNLLLSYSIRSSHSMTNGWRIQSH